ncbi:MAG: DPP IV N-terminal domain-containing protein [Acidobacteria bacterium]|nr:DPP IV N-terminal domain-containing protein [Acidobacteriota bacterium]
MKKERIRKPDGRYLIYYRFDEAEVSPTKGRAKAKHMATKRRAKGGGR